MKYGITDKKLLKVVSDRVDIGSKIKNMRKIKGFTQDYLAIKAEISRSYLADVEANRYNPSLSTLEKIAKALNIAVDELLKDDSLQESLGKLDEILRNLDNADMFNKDEKIKMRDNILSLINKAGLSGNFMVKEESLEYQAKDGSIVKSLESISSIVSLPIVGTVAAGAPILSEQNIEGYIPLPASFAKGENDFLLKVRGDSMEDVSINDGDLILVHQQPTAENGQTVIARINGEVTCKRFYKTDGKCILEPANSKYKPIDCKEVEIIGIVTRVIKEVF